MNEERPPARRALDTISDAQRTSSPLIPDQCQAAGCHQLAHYEADLERAGCEFVVRVCGRHDELLAAEPDDDLDDPDDDDLEDGDNLTPDQLAALVAELAAAAASRGAPS